MSVFANGLGVSGKATDNKTIAAMPDVCLSPPPPPAGPVPIPYPNFGMASDTTDGCTSVFIKGKEAGKKNASKYSKITGNEAATNSFGAGVISHKITGPLKFAAYSFDVMFEGGGAERFTDLTTTNHMNNPNGAVNASLAPPSPPDPPPESECAALKAKNAEFRKKNNQTEVKDGVSFDDSGTITHGNFYPAGGGAVPMAGASATRQLCAAGVKGLCQPVNTNSTKEPKGKFTTSSEGKKRVVMDICGGKCSHPVGGLHAHAELNILNEIGRRGPTSRADRVVLGIDWNSAKGKGDPNPCTNCQEAIRCACQCITIIICDEEGEPVNRCEQPYKK